MTQTSLEPIQGTALDALLRLGVTVERSSSTSSSSVSVQGIQMAGSTKTTLNLAFKLPQPARLEASFGAKGLWSSLVGLFKKSVVTGDQAFDGVVDTSAADQSVAARFLENAEARRLIHTIVTGGGSVAITPDRAHVSTLATDARDEEEVASRLVWHVLAFVG